jgi:hypothetical protein
MVNVPALFTGVGISQFKRKYFGRGVANLTKTTLRPLAFVAFIEVTLEDSEIFLQLVDFVTIIDVIEVS